MAVRVDSVRMESATAGKALIILEGSYTLFEVEHALRSLRQELRGLQRPLQQIELDWTHGLVDYSADELESLVNLLSGIAPMLIVRTADACRYDCARTLMRYCSAKGVTVHIHHQDI